MTEKQAEREGLTFTGHYSSRYSRDESDNVLMAKLIRKVYGCRAVVVKSCHGAGTSIYADDRYRELKALADYRKRVADEGEAKQKLLDEYQEKLAKLEASYAEKREYIRKIEEKYPDTVGQEYPTSIYDYMRANKIDWRKKYV